MKLTPQKRVFAKEYLVDLNATQAAIRAKYSVKTAYSQGQRLLKDVEVQKLIQEEMNKRSEKVGITSERVLNEIAKMAFFDVRKLFDDSGKPIHVSMLDDETAAAVAGLDIVTQGNSEIGYADVLKVKLADKARSLELLGKHLKLFTDKIEHTGNVTILASDLDENI